MADMRPERPAAPLLHVQGAFFWRRGQACGLRRASAPGVVRHQRERDEGGGAAEGGFDQRAEGSDSGNVHPTRILQGNSQPFPR